jgi:hypothetical protein
MEEQRGKETICQLQVLEEIVRIDSTNNELTDRLVGGQTDQEQKER